MSKHKKPRAPTPPEKTRFFTPGVIVGAIVLLAAVAAWPLYWWRHDVTHHSRAAAAPRPAATGTAPVLLGGKLRFTDVAAQSREFIGYYSTIHLTAAQEAIKREVLEAMPAACCRRSNAYTCCCTCNLSKSVWGLSNYVIAQHGAKADELRQVLRAWYDYTNPSGYSGDVCYDGGCSRAFHDNGCGGMSESNVVL